MNKIKSYCPNWGNEIEVHKNKIVGYNFYADGKKIAIKTYQNENENDIKEMLKITLVTNEENKKKLAELIKTPNQIIGYAGRIFELIDGEVTMLPV